MPAKALAALLCMLAAQAACAASVSLLVIDAGEEGPEYSAMWESRLFEAFFESGIVATNSPRIRLGGAPVADGFPPEAEAAREGARLGGIDFLLVAIVDGASRGFCLRLFSAESGAMAALRSGGSTAGLCAREERESISRAAMEMAWILRHGAAR